MINILIAVPLVIGGFYIALIGIMGVIYFIGAIIESLLPKALRDD